MSEDLFQAAPPPSGGISFKDYLGSLLLVDVIAHEHGISTTFGLNDAIRCNITVLDGALAGETVNDTLIFPKVLKSQLKNNVGGRLLGRLGQGVAKNGQSAPWLFEEVTENDKGIARQFLSNNFVPTGVAAPAARAPF